MHPGAIPPAYRFSEFGWLQFERLCSQILAAAAGSELEWFGRADAGRVTLVDGRLRDAANGTLEGPLTVVVAWVPSALRSAAAMGRLAAVVGEVPGDLGVPFHDRVLIVTNLDGAPAREALVGIESLRARTLVIWGAAELSDWLDRHLSIRQALPSVLGARDLAGLISPGVAAASTLDLERAAALARVFWPTRPYARARAVLQRHRFAVLTGPPEMGKTAIAQMLGLVQMTAGWEAHDCSTPDRLLREFDRHGRQVFIADDAFGSTEYRPDAAERWALALGGLLEMLDDDHWLIWTSRPAPLKAGLRRVQRERGSERFPAPGEVLVDATDLDLAEKTLILFRHARACGASPAARTLLRATALSIVEHPHFTPERIRRFVADRLDSLPGLAGGGTAAVEDAVSRELAVPTDAMRTSYRALAVEHRELLIALLDAPAGLIDQRALIATVRRHGATELTRSPGAVIDRLTDHFLRVTPLGIDWVHPSWRDLVIDELRDDAQARRRFLERCGPDGAILALSRAGGLGERELPLLHADADWDALAGQAERLVGHLEGSDLVRVLHSLEDAVAGAPPGAQRNECEALAETALRACVTRWHAERRAIPRVLVDAWYRLNVLMPRRVPSLPLARTWAELHPPSVRHAALERADLILADDWLGLAQTLARYDRPLLKSLGFLHRDQPLLTALVACLQRTTAADTRELVASILTRIEEVSPRHSEVAQTALDELERATREAPAWWVPEDLAAPPTTERVTPGPVQFTRADVRRVLADL